MSRSVYRHTEERIEVATFTFWEGPTITFRVPEVETWLFQADLYTDGETGYAIILWQQGERYFGLEAGEFASVRFDYYLERKPSMTFNNPRPS